MPFTSEATLSDEAEPVLRTFTPSPVTYIVVPVEVSGVVVAVGVGGELTAPAKKGEYDKVTENAKAFVAAVKAARGE